MAFSADIPSLVQNSVNSPACRYTNADYSSGCMARRELLILLQKIRCSGPEEVFNSSTKSLYRSVTYVVVNFDGGNLQAHEKWDILRMLHQPLLFSSPLLVLLWSHASLSIPVSLREFRIFPRRSCWPTSIQNAESNMEDMRRDDYNLQSILDEDKTILDIPYHIFKMSTSKKQARKPGVKNTSFIMWLGTMELSGI